jgi:hypothetical protein
MSLNKRARDSMAASDFAVPGKRALPIHDATHVRMAWDMVDRTKSLSEGERQTARSLILERAHALDIDTSDWVLKSVNFAISAMSLNMPKSSNHPNKSPFSGCLVRLDEPSDGSPQGAMGCKVLLTVDAAEAALPSLLGMAINYQSDAAGQLSGHNPQSKIGIIDEAYIERDARGPFVHIGGFFYAADFPTVVTQIKAEKDKLGFSFEAENLYLEDPESDPLVIKALTFTGAAVLQKNKAAYRNTRIAAHADDLTTEEDFPVTESEKILAAIAALEKKTDDRLKNIESGESQRTLAASVVEKVTAHADKIRAAADGLIAAKIGVHATRGYAAVLNHIADTMLSEAHAGRTPEIYVGLGIAAAAEVPATPVESEEVKTLKASVANLTTLVTDLKAKATSESAPPARKTVDPQVTRLMARAGLEAPEEGKQLEIGVVDAALTKANLPPEKRMELKAALRNAGALAG